MNAHCVDSGLGGKGNKNINLQRKKKNIIEHSGKPNYMEELFEIINSKKKIHYPLIIIFFLIIAVFVGIFVLYNDYFEHHGGELVFYLVIPFHLIVLTILFIIDKFSYNIKRIGETFILTKFHAFGMYCLYLLVLIPIAFFGVILNPEDEQYLYVIIGALLIALIIIIVCTVSFLSPIRIEINDKVIKYRSERYMGRNESFLLAINNIKTMRIKKDINKEGVGLIISTKTDGLNQRVHFGLKNNRIISNEISRRI